MLEFILRQLSPALIQINVHTERFRQQRADTESFGSKPVIAGNAETTWNGKRVPEGDGECSANWCDAVRYLVS